MATHPRSRNGDRLRCPNAWGGDGFVCSFSSLFRHGAFSLALLAAPLVPSALFVPATAHAGTWTGATNTDWFTATNWDTGIVPTAATDVFIRTATSGAPVISGATATDMRTWIGLGSENGALTISGGGVLASSSYSFLGDNIGVSGTVTVTDVGSAWNSGAHLQIGNWGTGTLNISNGGVVSNTYANVGNAAGSVGYVTVTGAGSMWTNSADIRVGFSGTGTLNVSSGGHVTNTFGYIGHNVGSTGTVSITGAGSTWTNSNNLFIGNSGVGELNIQNDADVSNTSGYIGNASTATGIVTVSGAGSTWTNSGSVNVGAFGTGTLNIEGGGIVSNVIGLIGSHPDSLGTANVAGAGSTWTSSGILYVGNSGTGSLTISAGGVVNAANALIGGNPGSTGVATVSGNGSRWVSSSDLCVGASGDGTLTISDGGVVNNVSVGYVGTHAGSTGTAIVTGAGSTWTNSGAFYVGNSSTGTLTVSTGADVANTVGYIGYNVGSTGTATVTGVGSTWTNTNGLYSGFYGTGSLTISAGATVTSIFGSVGRHAGATGTILVTGEDTLWTATGNMRVGESGAGTLVISDRAAVNSITGSVGHSLGATGTATVTGAGSTWTNSGALYVGNAGTGTLTIADDAVVSAVGTVTIASAAGSVGILNIGAAAGSAAVAAGTLSASTVAFGAGTGKIVFNHTEGLRADGSGDGVAGGATGSNTPFTFASALSGNGAIEALSGITYLTGNLAAFTGGTAVSDGAALFVNGAYGGDLTIDSSSETTINAAVAGDVSVDEASTLLINADVGGSVVADGGSLLTIAADIGGDVAVGAGTVSLTAAGSVGGGTTIGDGGVFSANGSVAGDVDVNDGGTLKGSGTVGSINAADGATIAPGNSIGTLHVAGDVNFAIGSVYDVEVNAVGQSDRIEATGAATIAGGTVNLLPEAGGTLGVGTTYTIIAAAGGVAGTFDAVTLDTASLFLMPSLSYDADNVFATISRNGTAFTSLAATPNESNVAAALDGLNGTNDAYNAVASLGTATDARAAYRRLSGELHADIKGSVIASQDKTFSLLSDRARQLTTGKNLWAQAYGEQSERNGDHVNTQEFTHKEKGVMFGLDGAPASLDHALVGIAFGYGRSDYDLVADPDNSAGGNADHYTLAAYGNKRWGDFSLHANGHYGLHQIDTDRLVSLTGYTARQRADYHAQTLSGSVEAALATNPTHNTTLEPFVSVSYGLAHLSSFAEEGGDGSLNADSDLASQGHTMLGGRAAHQLSLSGMTFEQASNDDANCNAGLLMNGTPCALLSAQLGWKHLVGTAEPAGSYSFAGSQRFKTEGAAAPRDALTTTIGLDLPLTAQAAVGLSYSGSFAPEETFSAARLAVSVKW